MTPALIIQQATADGVRLAVTPTGTTKAIGDQASVNRWVPIIRENKPGIVAALQEAANEASKPDMAGAEYSLADLAEMDRLLAELSRLEDWHAAELEQKLTERRRMAPANVPGALCALRAARDAALTGWPENPRERAQINLCRLVN